MAHRPRVNSLNPVNLLLALTPGTPLSVWERLGTYHREMQPYIYHVDQGGRLTILQSHFAKHPDLYGRMTIIKVPHWRFLSLWKPLIAYHFNSIDVIKTNQSKRAWLFTDIAKQWKKPILLRCGYIYGQTLEAQYGLTSHVQAYQAQESRAFQDATLIQVPTHELATWLYEKYRISETKVHIVPNFVDTNQFRPTFNEKVKPTKTRIVSVGRLSAVKRFDLILQACSIAETEIEVYLAGEGEEYQNLIDSAQKLNISLKMVGQIPNQELPAFLNEGDIFIIASKWEGHPKALIEAMACGLACIGVNSNGIQNIIKNNHTGLLVDAEPDAIARAISKLVTSPDLARRLGLEARKYVEENFAIDSILKRGQELIYKTYELGQFTEADSRARPR